MATPSSCAGGGHPPGVTACANLSPSAASVSLRVPAPHLLPQACSEASALAATSATVAESCSTPPHSPRTGAQPSLGASARVTSVDVDVVGVSRTDGRTDGRTEADAAMADLAEARDDASEVAAAVARTEGAADIDVVGIALAEARAEASKAGAAGPFRR